MIDFNREASLTQAAGATRVNSVLPRFTLKFIYDRAAPGKLRLKGYYLWPFDPENYEWGPFGGCVGCPGRGHFADPHSGSIVPFAHRFGHTPSQLGIPPKFINHTYSEVAHGKILMARNTRFIEATIGPKIGRYGIFGLNVNGRKLVTLRGGCIPAYLDWYASGQAIASFLLDHVRDLPTVPCHQTVPADDHIGVYTPLELSSHGPTDGVITGHATGSQWMIAFQVPANTIKRNQPACWDDALAELGRNAPSFQQRVSGNFYVRFRTLQASSPGFMCVYLQEGGRLYNGKYPWPDGRVTASASSRFLAGDSVRIAAPASVPAGQSFTTTFTGNASSSNEELYVFVPATPCASTAQAEFATDPYDGAVDVRRGGFTHSVRWNPPASSGATYYVCAYLQYGKARGPSPVGATLAAATSVFSTSGAGGASDLTGSPFASSAAARPIPSGATDASKR